MVSTRSGKRTSTSGPRTRSQGARTGGSARRRTLVSARPRQRTVEVVVRFGPRKGKKTKQSCLLAGSKLKTTRRSDWGKKLRKCRTNKIA